MTSTPITPPTPTKSWCSWQWGMSCQSTVYTYGLSCVTCLRLWINCHYAQIKEWSCFFAFDPIKDACVMSPVILVFITSGLTWLLSCPTLNSCKGLSSFLNKAGCECLHLVWQISKSQTYYSIPFFCQWSFTVPQFKLAESLGILE